MISIITYHYYPFVPQPLLVDEYISGEYLMIQLWVKSQTNPLQEGFHIIGDLIGSNGDHQGSPMLNFPHWLEVNNAVALGLNIWIHTQLWLTRTKIPVLQCHRIDSIHSWFVWLICMSLGHLICVAANTSASMLHPWRSIRQAKFLTGLHHDKDFLRHCGLGNICCICLL